MRHTVNIFSMLLMLVMSHATFAQNPEYVIQQDSRKGYSLFSEGRRLLPENTKLLC